MMAVLKKTFTQEYAKFDGRVSKQDFWNWTVAMVAVNAVINILVKILADVPLIGGVAYALSAIVGLGVLCPSIGISIRRCHDLNLSGKFVLWNLVCCIGGIYFLYTMWGEGNTEANQYGPVPEDTPAENPVA